MARRPGRSLYIRLIVAFAAVSVWASNASADRPSLRAAPRESTAAEKLQIRTVSRPTSSRLEAAAVQKRLPLEHLDHQKRSAVLEVLNSISLFRRLPGLTFEIEPDVYRYFTEHPDVAVSIWRVMDISKFQMWQTGPFEFEVNAGDGSTGITEVVYRDEDECLVICNGKYKSPLLIKPIKCRGLMHLTYSFSRDQCNVTHVTHHMAVYVSFPSHTVKTAAKVLSPVTNVIMDRNFQEVSAFARMMSLAMRHQPGWVENTAGRMDGVLRRRRDELVRLTARVYVAERKRKLASTNPGSRITIEQIMSPLRVASGDD